jgi:M6 family metalloprotease-like protein
MILMRRNITKFALLIASSALLIAILFGAQASRRLGPAPLDPQKVQDQQDMTWADYHPIPGINWADPSRVPTRKQYKVALIAVDFDDQPFVITQKKKSDLFGNPQMDPISREKVPQFYADFFNTPSEANHGQTINGFWMEQSRGQIGIAKLDAFGPYRMPKKLFQYGLNEWGQNEGVPTGYVADGRLEQDCDALWTADKGAEIRKNYDFILRIYAGYDETGVWQEFGEMKFQDKDSIPAEWGNPDTTKPRWVVTRYLPWTSWKAGQMQWGISSVRQGENSGTITHEIAHLAFRIGDNNNNPYVKPYRRVGSGPWDLMDRGSFNGPGGPHNRWQVPPTQGAAMPAGMTLRSRMKLGFVTGQQVLKLNRNELAQTGLAVAKVTARAVDPGPDALTGVKVTLDGDAPQDRTPKDDMNANPLSPGDPVWNDYTLEVVQRIGYDSFTSDNGVMLAKNKDRETNSCGYRCFTWVIDAHPEDMNMVDFKRPNGETVMRTVADYRQLNDALFHAGLNSGSQYEWEDTPNRLHFYVVDVAKDSRGVLTYTVGVKSLDGAGPQKRGVSLAAAAPPQGAQCGFKLTNTGEGAAEPAYLANDIYRLSVTAEGGAAQLTNALVAAPFGGSAIVPVYATAGKVTLKAVSESDPSKTATATCSVKR